MKLAIDEAVEVEFDAWALEQAQGHLDAIKQRYTTHSTGKFDAGRFDTAMSGMFTLLFFGQLEKQQPGITQRLMRNAEKLAKAMSPPEPSE